MLGLRKQLIDKRVEMLDLILKKKELKSEIEMPELPKPKAKIFIFSKIQRFPLIGSEEANAEATPFNQDIFNMNNAEDNELASTSILHEGRKLSEKKSKKDDGSRKQVKKEKKVTEETVTETKKSKKKGGAQKDELKSIKDEMKKTRKAINAIKKNLKSLAKAEEEIKSNLGKNGEPVPKDSVPDLDVLGKALKKGIV